MKKELVKDRTFLRKLVSKVVGNNKEEQVELLAQQARKISSTTYVQAALKLIPAQPDFLSLKKNNLRHHAHVHNLIDLILPIAASSDLFSAKRSSSKIDRSFYTSSPFYQQQYPSSHYKMHFKL